MAHGCNARRPRGPLAFVSFVLTVAAASVAGAQQALDQQNLSSAYDCLNAGSYTMGQTFTPNFSRMNFAEIHLYGSSSAEATNGDFTLRVLRNGNLVRESEHLTLQASPNTPTGYHRFNFPDEAFLVPGQVHELQLVNHSSSTFFSWCLSQTSSYSGGAPVISPSPPSGGDFLFRTGMQSIYGPPQAVTHGDGYMVFESALPPPTPPGAGGGISIGSNFFSGVNFEITEPTKLKRVGAYFSSGSGQIFGAVFQTTGFAGVPNPANLSGADVVATTLITPQGSGGEAWGNVDVTLQPGWYGVLFGSGKFGASGTSGLRDLMDGNGFWSPYTVRQSDGQRFFQSGEYRIFVEAESLPGTASARPAFDTQAAIFAGQWILTDGDTSLVGDRFDFYGTDERALLEFSLSDVPEDAKVTSVELRLNPTQITGGGGSGPRLFFHGYSGDGVASAADAAMPLNEIGATPLVTNFDPIEVALDPAYIESLVAQGATHLGLMVRGDNNGHRVHFSAWEDGEPDRVPQLTIHFALPGDYDQDGTVGPSDYALWRSTFGATGPDLAADGNGNGEVDAADYIVWLEHANAAAGTALAGADNVPEPSTIALVFGVVLVAGLWRRSCDSTW